MARAHAGTSESLNSFMSPDYDVIGAGIGIGIRLRLSLQVRDGDGL